MFRPFQKHLIISNFSKEETIEKLNSITYNKLLTGNKNVSKKFEGEIDNYGFTIYRIINYRNSFLPIIKGNFVSQNGNSTLIEMRIQMNIFASIFMSIWFLISGVIFLNFLYDQFGSKNFDFKSLVFIVGFIITGYLIMILGFNYEAKKSKEILSQSL